MSSTPLSWRVVNESFYFVQSSSWYLTLKRNNVIIFAENSVVIPILSRRILFQPTNLWKRRIPTQLFDLFVSSLCFSPRVKPWHLKQNILSQAMTLQRLYDNDSVLFSQKVLFNQTNGKTLARDVNSKQSFSANLCDGIKNL